MKIYLLKRFKKLLYIENSTFIKRDFSLGIIRCEIKIDKILIANRGEIACRISKTAKKLGIKTVAIYSDIDQNSMHVDLADEAYNIGPASSSQSYLKQDKIISIAKSSNCQAIHPGYGFLSENAEFAEFCEKQNIIFIGPSAKAIRNMGIKSMSKAIMAGANVPVINGYHGNDQSYEILIKEAQKIGFPIMIKAVCGGGGKGMRIVYKETEFFESLESAKRESQKAFGDSTVLLEQYIFEPRHIEVQIFGDRYGNMVYLFERDCSIQRRHQKVIEEAPAPEISEKLRIELGKAAIQAAKAIDYVGAGTVEFIMNTQTQKFHFMEMNTRLQVEHPVTELITGIDLVEWQIRIAANEPLPLKQKDIYLNGHAFEARIYAEDPKKGFLPGAGKLHFLTLPSINEHVRVETGVKQNDEVSVYYDPMIAKLVVWGKNRHEALNILHSKLSNYCIIGLETNVEFIKDICMLPKFRKGKIHTRFIEENFDSLFSKIQAPDNVLIQGALGLILYEELHALEISIKSNLFNSFSVETGVRLNHFLNRRLNFYIDDQHFFVDIQYIEADKYSMKINDISQWKSVTGTLKKQKNTLELKLVIDGVVQKSKLFKIGNELHLFTHDRKWRLNISLPKYMQEFKEQEISVTSAAVSPIPGVVDKIFVKKGDNIKNGDPLIIIIAMKMEYIIKATSDNYIEDIYCNIGDNVVKNKLLVRFKK